MNSAKSIVCVGDDVFLECTNPRLIYCVRSDCFFVKTVHYLSKRLAVDKWGRIEVTEPAWRDCSLCVEAVLKNVLCKASCDLLLHVTPAGTVLKNDIVTAKYLR